MTGGDVRVRAATASDLEFVLGLVPDLLSFGPPPPWRDAEHMGTVDLAVMEDAVRGRTPGSLIMIAEAGEGERLGFIHLSEEEDYYAGACGHVGDIVVAASARGRGVGRTLLRAAEQWARGEGYSLITLNVFLGNEKAARVYESVGYNAETTRYVKKLD
jgi:GNAT superfamily N-acetyltransferase